MSYSERTLEGNWCEDKYGKFIVSQGGDPREMLGKWPAPTSSYERDFKDRFSNLEKRGPSETATACLEANMLFSHCPDMSKYESLGKREFYQGSKYFYQDPATLKLGDISPEKFCTENPAKTWSSTYQPPKRWDPYETTSGSGYNNEAISNYQTVTRHPRANGECAKVMNANWRNMKLRQE